MNKEEYIEYFQKPIVRVIEDNEVVEIWEPIDFEHEFVLDKIDIKYIGN